MGVNSKHLLHDFIFSSWYLNSLFCW